MAIDKIGSKALTDSSVVAADISPGTITADKLASTLNVSSKTVTLPNTSVTSGMLAGSIANAKLTNSTVTVNGTSIALGASGSIPAVTWQSVVVSNGSTVTTMVAGNGYFINNTSAAGLVKLPTSASAGDTIAIKDYAGNFGTNSLTIQRNGHNIQGVVNDSQISTNRASLSLVYVDATKGWLYAVESNVDSLQQALYVTATGGTVATSGNFKIHSFTGDANFVVSCGGNPIGNTKVDYLVVAGGGGGGTAATGCSSGAGGGGGGGYRESYTPAVSGSYTASPLKAACGALTVTAQTYPVTVGAGGGAPNSGPDNGPGQGNNSIFSTITSAGGGAGANAAACVPGRDGGSGGGGANAYPSNPNLSGGAGNQGFNGGNGTYNQGSGGGGGAGGAGTVGSPSVNGHGGVGVITVISGSPTAYAGGGGGGDSTAVATGGGRGGGSPSPQFGGGNGGTRDSSSLPVRQGGAGGANTGGGGGASASGPQRDQTGGAGGSGIVVIRYKFQ